MGGYLGAQTGSGGANGVDAWDKYYYHFSDLGTVLATTDGDGAMLGVYQPDFWGNYRSESYGVRPDTMGLTGKCYDEDIDLYYFYARWYDPERGRFMSKDFGIGKESLNSYDMVSGVLTSLVDVNGKQAQVPADGIRSQFRDLCLYMAKGLLFLRDIKGNVKEYARNNSMVEYVDQIQNAVDHPCDFITKLFLDTQLGNNPSRAYWDKAMDLYCNGIDCALSGIAGDAADDLIDKTIDMVCNKRRGVFEKTADSLHLQDLCQKCQTALAGSESLASCNGICDLARLSW